MERGFIEDDRPISEEEGKRLKEQARIRLEHRGLYWSAEQKEFIYHPELDKRTLEEREKEGNR